MLVLRRNPVTGKLDLVGDNDAIHDNVAGEINAITEKTTPIGADLGLIEDSADSNNKKKVQLSNWGKAIKLDDLATPDDNTDLDATTGRHGLLLKLGGGTTNFLRADGTWASPAAGGLVLPRGYIDGFIMSNDTDADHDISVSIGQARDSGNGVNLELASAMVKRIDAVWAAGTGNGGLFSGSVAADTWYHMFVIEKDSDDSIDVGFDTSITASNIPAGYTEYRRIGSVKTNGSANIIAFTQIGDYFFWTDPPLDVNVSTLGTSAVLYTVSVPPDVNVWVFGNELTKQAAGTPNVYVRMPSVANDEAPSGSAGPLGNLRTTDINKAMLIGPQWFLSNTSRQISARSSLASTTFQFSTLGYMDFRGKQ